MGSYCEHLIDLAAAAAAGGRFAAGEALLRLAVGRSGRDAFVLYGIGHMAWQQGDYLSALAWLDRSIAMDASNPKAHIDRGFTLFGLRRDRDALASLERGLEMDPDLALAVLTEGIDQLRAGDFRRGWWKFEARLIASPGILPRRVFARPRWFGDPAEVAGRTLLLHSEQGHGDAIQFVRYVPMVAAMGARVLVEGHKGLVPLYRGMPAVAGAFALNDALPPYDLHCPILSLPLAFRTELAGIPGTVPYLAAPADRVPFWQRLLGPPPRERLRIGIAWSGNPAYPADRDRSMPLALQEPLLAGTNHAFHIVQTEIREADRPVLMRQGHVRDHSERLADFGDTAALLSLLDLLITVDTSVAHLGGALGMPVWLLLPAHADWRWLTGRDDTPWYPTMRLFRQNAAGAWGEVVDRVLDELARCDAAPRSG
ncbi:MAG TPA: tetratricopeptide repeat protein [Acetobacteraceae bacterium]|nr:tetratricopeptide repeat protein [Acetobacteraceae bacterium]